LPEHLDGEYLLLFLLALQQRFALISLSEQVTQRRHHHRCYLRWQETFQIERLYREVSDEVHDMHQYLQMEKTERIERLAEQDREQSVRTEKTLNILAAFLLLPALVLNFLSAVGNQSWVRVWCGLLLALAAGSLLMIALQRRWFTCSTWRKKSSRDGSD
jgi:cation transport ATPase